MARETAKERKLRVEAEIAAERAANIAAYPKLFLETIAAALDENFELIKVDPETSEFTLCDRDNCENYVVLNAITDYDFEYGYSDSLTYLADEISRKQSKRAEIERNLKLRDVALSKLNAEDREILGL